MIEDEDEQAHADVEQGEGTVLPTEADEENSLSSSRAEELKLKLRELEEQALTKDSSFLAAAGRSTSTLLTAAGHSVDEDLDKARRIAEKVKGVIRVIS